MVGSKFPVFVGETVPLGRSGNLATIEVFSVEFAVAVVFAATYFFIAAWSGLKGRGFWFCLPELALPETSDKVAFSF